MSDSDRNLVRVRVWDLPTRLFHWILAVSVIGSVVSAKIGGNAMVWHFRFGTIALALLAFRLLWGFFGGRWSRFSSFFYSPGAVLRYLRGQTIDGDRFDVGHNPLGSFSVFALLLLLALQVATGLMADDEIGNTGPLYAFVSSQASALATSWHHGPGQWLLIVLITLHVAAIAYYWKRRRQNLVKPMVDGDKLLHASVPPSRDSARTRLVALVIAALCAGVARWIQQLG